MPEARPDSLGSTSLIAARRTGLNAMPAPIAEQDHARQHVDDEVPVDRRPREESEADRREREADASGQPDAEAHHELRREAERERAHDQVGGQEGEARPERAVAKHELEVEGGEEEPGEHRGRP